MADALPNIEIEILWPGHSRDGARMVVKQDVVVLGYEKATFVDGDNEEHVEFTTVTFDWCGHFTEDGLAVFEVVSVD